MYTNTYCIYIMSNQNNTVLYVGVTNNLIRRVFEHKNHVVDGFTKEYNVDKLVYYEVTEDVNSAIEREKQLKGWTRKKKDMLIDTLNPSREDLYEKLV